MRLKIYSDRQYLALGQKHNVILLPFWGANSEIEEIASGRFDRYAEIGSRYFKMVSLQKADLVVLPGEWLGRNPNMPAYRLASAAQKFGKLLVIFFNSDSDEAIPIKNSFIFRTSFYRSTRQYNEFALPAWSEDLVKRYFRGKLNLRLYKPVPVISFCGYSSSIRAQIWNGIGRLFMFNGLFTHGMTRPIQFSGRYLRWLALKKISENSNVITNFIIRRKYWNGIFSKGKLDMVQALRSRYEFTQNIVKSDYVLCAPGVGNFTYRLYESLSLGRIPIFINTDCVLPYEAFINWKKYVVWIEPKEIDQIADRVLAFHASLTPFGYRKLQLDCRKLWEEWLSPQGFFANFHRHFHFPVNR